MPRHYDQLHDDYVTGEPLPADEYNSLVRILDTQAAGALEGVGSGVVDGGEVTAGTGLSVSVTALTAVVDTQYGKCFVSTYGSDATVTDLPDDSTCYIWARAVFAANPGDPDSRESGHVEFYWALSDEGEADALLLAEVTTSGGVVTAVTDRRTLIPARHALQLAQSLSDDLSDVRAAIGEAYFGANPPASLHDRVTALESGGGGEGGPVYWGGLEKGAGDPTTIEQQIDADIAQHVADYHTGQEEAGGAVIVEEWDVDAADQARLVLKLARSVDPDAPKYFSDAAVVVWNVYGDGTAGTPDFIDRTNSTWLPS